MNATITIVNDKARNTFVWDVTNEKGNILQHGSAATYTAAFLASNDAATRMGAKSVEVEFVEY